MRRSRKLAKLKRDCGHGGESQTNMAYDVPSQQLIELNVQWRTGVPHVVILGAGASLAAFPSGDARGRRLPLTANVVDVLGMRKLIENAGHDPQQDFESLYSTLHSLDPKSPVLRQIEQRVTEYFSDLELPRYQTLYDFLLLSLREKDAIFTFNWDPFLVDAYERHSGDVPLPQIFHLHGNVRVSFCPKCRLAMPNAKTCQSCCVNLIPTPLLYPIEQKDYATDPFISTQWNAARRFISRAGVVTIFGYSAPTTDKEAMAIFTEAWKGDGPEKPIERVEIIDTKDGEELAHQWSQFAHFSHYDIRHSFFESMLARYPRRSCEALAHAGINGEFVEPIPWAGNLLGLKKTVEELISHEE
jgi:hypothetical protein